MRSEGFLFVTGGSGGGTVFVPILEVISRTTAHVHVRAPSRSFARVRDVPDALCPEDWLVPGLFGGSVTPLCRGDWW